MDASKHTPDAPVPLESVLCTEELLLRPSRPPDYQAENRALVALVQALADSPRTILQTLADTILEVFKCDSAGISLLTTRDDGKRFYWPAIAGAWKPHIGGGTPRDFGPCGDVLDRDAPLLFRHFERRYTYFKPVTPPTEECLLVPFYVEGKAVGTIWAISHDDRRKFDAEDERQLVSLGRFASAAYKAHASFDASERLAAIVESSDDAIISKDLNAIIRSWNRGAERLFGYTAQEAIGQPISMLVPHNRVDEVPGILERIRRGERVEHFETVRRRKDGTLLDVSLAVSPIHDARGWITGASKIARDITERKLAEQALKEADRRKNEFLAMLAHELRNPLAPISNALQVMRLQGGDENAVQSAFQMMERQVGQIVRLVDDLLDLSRVSRGNIELRREQVELESVVNHAVEAARPHFESMGQELTVTLPTAPVYLNGDPIRLIQVLGNLLSNAGKFTAKGGRIWLSVETESPQAILRVRDNGIGLAAHQLRRIFEMFTQVDTSLERTQTGLGIGLTLVKSLVEMHGGEVKARSAGLGHGSEFVVRLPILVAKSSEPPQPPVTEPTPTMSRRILVVDDNRDAAESLAMLLKLTGHETQIAYDGVEAVESAASFRPDVVLLDIGLPKLNGYEAARKIREQGWSQGIVLIALTGWDQKEDRQKAKEFGFDGHLVKPVDHAALMKLLADSSVGAHSS